MTTGGTGPSPRDVTPEATEAVCSKMMPGCAAGAARGRKWRASSWRCSATVGFVEVFHSCAGCQHEGCERCRNTCLPNKHRSPPACTAFCLYCSLQVRRADACHQPQVRPYGRAVKADGRHPWQGPRHQPSRCEECDLGVDVFPVTRSLKSGTESVGHGMGCLITGGRW